MFTETIFKPNFVAVREIGAPTNDFMIVCIFEKIPFAGMPELWNTVQRMHRRFEGTMPAMIRHSSNWISKLEREYLNTYWNEESREWGCSSSLKVFFNHPSDVPGFLSRLQNLSSRAGAISATGNRQISIEQVVRSLQDALDTAVAPGTINRSAVVHRFIEGIRP